MEPLGSQIILADYHQGPVPQAVQPGDDMGPVDLCQAGGRSGSAGVGRIQQLSEFRQLLQRLQQQIHLITSFPLGRMISAHAATRKEGNPPLSVMCRFLIGIWDTTCPRH